MVFCCKIYI